MLGIAQQMADEIIGGARLTAEQTLYEAVRDAGAAHPVAQEAREQADKLLADATAEARRLARERHEDLEAQIAEAAASLEAVRRQQGELLGALLRLRGMVGSDDFERTLTALARAGQRTAPDAPRQREAPPEPGAATATPADAPVPGAGGQVGAPHRPFPAGAEVLNGELYPVESTPVSPAAGPAGADRRDIVDVEIVDEP